jgi:PEP-CTERM motif
MPVSLAPRILVPQITMRRGLAVSGLLALAAALSIASYSRGDLLTSVSDVANHGLSDIKTVAAMLADRSPGRRPKGQLASLKPKRQAALHERALPKVRRPAPPANPLASLIGPSSIAPVPTPAIETSPAPLYSMVGGPLTVVPPVVVPGGGTPSGGGTPGGPPVFTDIPPSGGGGSIVVPPPITTSEVPPVTSAVPEPDTWAMMLVGFALMGWVLRRDRRAAAKASAG